MVRDSSFSDSVIMAHSLSRRDAIAQVIANLAEHGRRPHLHQGIDLPGKVRCRLSLRDVLVQQVF
jgi:hypothetical protein